MLKILYAKDKTAAFRIATRLYYIKTGPDFPELYDENLQKQIVPNMDYWLQAQTQQRYSFRGLCDMIEAFKDGIQHSYNRDDLVDLCDFVCDRTLSYVFKTSHTTSLARAYWIEILDPEQVKKLIAKISNKLEEFEERFGSDKFYDYLCRLWQFCNFHIPSEAPVVEKLALRVGKDIGEPTYPLVDAEHEIKSHIVTKDVGAKLDEYKGVEHHIKVNVDAIQTRRL